MSYRGKFNFLNEKSYASNLYSQKSVEGNAPPPPQQIYMMTEDDQSMLTEDNFYMVKEN